MKLIRLLVSSVIAITWASVSVATPQRVVTIGGALTETMYALGAEHLLVGNDTTSYYPAAAEHLPKIGYQRALSAEGILSLAPDLLIYTDDAGPPAVLEQLSVAGLKLLKIKAARNFSDVKKSIQRIGDAIDDKASARALIAKFDTQIAVLDSALAVQTDTRRVMFVLQHSGGAPLVAGTHTAADSMITLSGGENVVSAYRGYKPLTPEALVALKPEFILVTTQGLAQTGGSAQLLKIPGLAFTPAASTGNVIAMDALLLLGFGPRTADAARQLHRHYQQL